MSSYLYTDHWNGICIMFLCVYSIKEKFGKLTRVNSIRWILERFTVQFKLWLFPTLSKATFCGLLWFSLTPYGSFPEKSALLSRKIGTGLLFQFSLSNALLLFHWIQVRDQTKNWTGQRWQNYDCNVRGSILFLGI